MSFRSAVRPGLLAAGLALLPAVAAASCGAAFCPINTQWEVQGAWRQSGWRVDLRQEFIAQDRLRQGREALAPGSVHRHHDEMRTLNRTTLLSLDYGAERWGLSLTLPWLNRDHFHIHNHMGTPLDERWQLEGAGDARLLGRFQPGAAPLGLLAGLKLPTGTFHAANAAGDLAERSLQPGSGTTDLLLGASWQRGSLRSPWSGFVQGLWQQPLDERAEYQPGYQASVDAGLRYAVWPDLGLLLQLNALARGRDSGLEAEADDSGSRHVFLSPGLSWRLNEALQVYAFVQQPLYQHVNGLQLTADQAYTAGLSLRF